MGFIFYVMLGVVYAVVGFVLSFPYMWLADAQTSMEVVFFAPIIGFLMFLAWVFSFAMRKWWMFFAALAVLCIPIVLNGLSHFLSWFGYVEASAFAHEYRFAALGIVVVGPIALLCLFGTVLETVAWARKRFMPPPASPPTPPVPSSALSPDENVRRACEPDDDITQCIWVC